VVAVYPCHVPPRGDAAASDRHRPVQIRRVQAEQSIKTDPQHRLLEAGRPYLDGIEYTIIRSASTWILALGAQQFDRTGPGFIPISLLKEIKSQAPGMNCEIASWNTSRTAIMNRAAPLDNAQLRRGNHWRSTQEPSSTSSAKVRARSARRCSRRPRRVGHAGGNAGDAAGI
jgi:hypothetical protein